MSWRQDFRRFLLDWRELAQLGEFDADALAAEVEADVHGGSLDAGELVIEFAEACDQLQAHIGGDCGGWVGEATYTAQAGWELFCDGTWLAGYTSKLARAEASVALLMWDRPGTVEVFESYAVAPYTMAEQVDALPPSPENLEVPDPLKGLAALLTLLVAVNVIGVLK